MRILFNEKIAQGYDGWFETKKGALADWFEKELMSRMVELKPGEIILDIGCGTGNHLRYFLEKGLKTIGVDISLPMLRVAQHKVGERSGLCLGRAEALPFKANCFDCVSLMTTLEFVEDPLKVLQEMVRVSRDKVLLGVLNKYSITGISRRLKGLLRRSIYNEARFYSIWELKRLLTKVLGKGNLTWGSTLILPLSLQERFENLERTLSFWKNPFGAFLAVGISIKKVS
jgi:ubiquinone/menaquinone biosynthesis C-methylase UbiE